MFMIACLNFLIASYSLQVPWSKEEQEAQEGEEKKAETFVRQRGGHGGGGRRDAGSAGGLRHAAPAVFRQTSRNKPQPKDF